MSDRKIVYISGKITGDPDYHEKFDAAENVLRDCGYIVINPASKPEGLSYDAYMRLSFAEIAECDIICLLPDWEDSHGARNEKEYAEALGKEIMNYKSPYANANRCVCCDAIIPEGGHVCPNCRAD